MEFPLNFSQHRDLNLPREIKANYTTVPTKCSTTKPDTKRTPATSPFFTACPFPQPVWCSFCMARVLPISTIQMNQQLQYYFSILHGHGENQRWKLPNDRRRGVRMSTFPRQPSPRHLLRRKPFGFLFPSFFTRGHFNHPPRPFSPFPPQTPQTTPNRLQDPGKLLSRVVQCT